MFSHAILLAETDHHTLDILPGILAAHIPHMAIDICTSPDELVQKLEAGSYDTIALSPLLIRSYRFFTTKRTPQLRPSLIVTVSREDQILPYEAVEGDAFDVIIKPINPDQAAQTVKLALAHTTLRRVRASRDRVVARFQEHMAAYPQDLMGEEQFLTKLAIFDRTLQALNVSIKLVLNIDEESYVSDMAERVEGLTRQRAFDRLLNLYTDGPTQ